MNPQPDPMIGNVFAFMFVLGIMIYAYKSYLEGHSIKIHNLDNFVIGYIEDYTYVEKPQRVRTKLIYNKSVKVPSKKTTKKVKSAVVETETTTTTTLPPQPPERDEQLYNDCINSLIALGYKKTEAKNQTKHVFDKNNVTSIQEFIKLITINTIDFK